MKSSNTTATLYPLQIVPYRSGVFPPPPQPLLHLELLRLRARLTGLASRGLLPKGSRIRCCSLSLRPTGLQYLPPPPFSPRMRRARLWFRHYRSVLPLVPMSQGHVNGGCPVISGNVSDHVRKAPNDESLLKWLPFCPLFIKGSRARKVTNKKKGASFVLRIYKSTKSSYRLSTEYLPNRSGRGRRVVDEIHFRGFLQVSPWNRTGLNLTKIRV